MKLLLRLWHELDTLQSWLFDGEPHIDGHCYQDKKLWKDDDKYRLISECDCGKKSESWMSEIMYLQQKDSLPKLVVPARGDRRCNPSHPLGGVSEGRKHPAQERLIQKTKHFHIGK